MITMLSLIAALGAAQCDTSNEDWNAQDFATFDQTEAGWRSVARRDCFDEAADLIADYRAYHQGTLSAHELSGLLWHEGQMRAIAGDTQAAITPFATSRRDEDPLQLHYANATIAFLRQDRAALMEARETLAAIPEPEGFAAAMVRFRENYPDDTPPEWPLNLNIVDRFVACFEESYEVAYSGCPQAGE